MQSFGANSLYLAPEYLGKVNALSTAFVGFGIGVFIMSWNISTFIVNTKHIRFLATTAQPFLKYCINNAVIPLCFLVFYFYNAVNYASDQELISTTDIIILVSGFLGGFAFSIFISFVYFFSADKTIYRRMGNAILKANKQYERILKRQPHAKQKTEIRVDWFLSASFGLRKPRNVNHYSQDFFDSIFKRHHIAAVLAILFAFICLLIIGFFSDNDIFQVPAAASITVFFAILITVETAFSLFLGSWVLPVVLILYIGINWMYQENIIDPRNKAYGLNYTNENERPSYNRDSIMQMVSPQNTEADKQVFFKHATKLEEQTK